MMKKILLTLLVMVLAIMAYFLFQSSQVGVHVNNVSQSEAELIEKEFAAATGNKLMMVCENSGNQNEIECQGNYTVGNLVQLAYYQNRLFSIAAKRNLDFTSFASGSLIATLFD